MGAKSFNPNDPKVQLEVTKETLRNLETKHLNQKNELEQAYVSIDKKDFELKKAIEERNDLLIQQERFRQQALYLQLSLTQCQSKLDKQENKNKWASFFVFILTFVATCLVGIGASLVVNPLVATFGWLMIIFATAVYIIAGLLLTQTS